MFIPSPDCDLVAFGLNIVDDDAPDYAGWSVPPLQGACNDASAYAILGALAGLKSTAVLSTYAGQFTAIGPNLPPYRKVLDCTRNAVSRQITARSAFVADGMKNGRDPVTVLGISGHGSREAYLLEAIESLVLSDGLMPDYELHNLLALFPSGSRVAVFVDTCHSGGMDRATSFRHQQKFIGTFHRQAERAAKPMLRTIKANVAFFAACKRETTALDGQFNGAFTGSLMAMATHAIKAKRRPSWLEVMDGTRSLCMQQFRQEPVSTFYGNADVWKRPFLT